MTTRYDRMRAAAQAFADFDILPELQSELEADADRLEAVEREMRGAIDEFDGWPGQMIDWADRIRGEK